MSSTSTPETTPEPEVEEPQTEVTSADATPDAANDNDAAPADQPDITEPANDNQDATTATFTTVTLFDRAIRPRSNSARPKSVMRQAHDIRALAIQFAC